MSDDLIFTQIYPMINYFCLKSVFSSIFWDKRDTIGLSKTTKISTLIFLPTSAPFILFLLFLGKFWGVTQKLGYDTTYGNQAKHDIYFSIVIWNISINNKSM